MCSKHPRDQISSTSLNRRRLLNECRFTEREEALKEERVDILGLAEVRKQRQAILENRYGQVFSDICETKGNEGIGIATPNTNRKKKKECTLNIATFNVRSLLSNEREIELEHAIENIHYDIIGLCEIRKTGEAIIEKKNGDLFSYIGETKGQKGVGFIIHKKFKNTIEDIVGISERICVLTLKLGRRKISIIQAYAPTTNSTEEELEDFYNLLDNTLNKYRSERNFVIGDFNCKVGRKTNNTEEMACGPFGLGIRNERGERLIEFAEEHKLKIINTFYKLNNQDRWTWLSPDGQYKNEIDYILTDDLESVINLKVEKQLKFESDHRLIKCDIRIRKDRTKYHHPRKLPIQDFNKIMYQKALRVEIETRIKMDQEVPTQAQKSTQEKYNNLEQCILSAGKNAAIDKSRPNEKCRLSEDTLQLINQRELLRSSRQTPEHANEYKELNKKVKRSIRRDRRNHLTHLTHKIMENSKSLKLLKEKTSIGKHWMLSLKNTDDKKISSRKNINKTATQYYRSLYESTCHTLTNRYNDNEKDESEIPPFIISEIRGAILEMKTGKTPGDDGITVELLKEGTDELLREIVKLFNHILTTEELPLQWFTSTIILIHKKGNRDDLTNYRPISLMSNMYKLFSKIMTKRLTNILDEQQPPEQAGFRTGFSTTDHLQTINQIIEKAQEFNIKLYIAFVDFTKAFDCVEHPFILQALKNQGVPTKYINILKQLYAHGQAQVRTDQEGEIFRIKRGVRQGDPISPKLFNSLLEMCFRKINWSKQAGVNVNGRRLTNLRFADDIALFATSPETLKEMLRDVNERCTEVGLQMNLSKTKIMSNSEPKVIIMNNNTIDYVHEYVYLGQLIAFTNRGDKEVRRRIKLAWRKFWSLSFILINKKINLKIKTITMDMCILPVLLYGSQTWSLTVAQMKMIQRCQRKMERKILNISLLDRIPSMEIRKKTKIKDAVHQAKMNKWHWGGHIIRQDQRRWAYTTTTWDPRYGWRNQGRQKRRWADELSKLAGPTWTRLAQERSTWRQLGYEHHREDDAPQHLCVL